MRRWARTGFIIALGWLAAAPAAAQSLSPSTAPVIPGNWISNGPVPVTFSTALPPTYMDEVWNSTESAPPPVLWLEHRVANTFGWAFGPVGKSLHVLGLEFGGGYNTDADLLKPYADRGFNELLDWDSRIVINDQGYGLHTQYRNPGFFKKIAFSITEKQDTAALIGLGSARDATYHSLDLSPQLPAHGYNVGGAAVLNPYIGFAASYDRSQSYSDQEYTTFNRRVAFGVGVTPLGTNGGKDWNVSIVPTLYYDRVNDLQLGVPDNKAGLGYGLGPDYYHGLEQIHLPWIFRHVRPDRADLSLIYGNTPIGGVVTSLSLNITAYLTHWLKLSMGASVNYYNVTGDVRTTSESGATLRITLFDFPM